MELLEWLARMEARIGDLERENAGLRQENAVLRAENVATSYPKPVPAPVIKPLFSLELFTTGQSPSCPV